MKQPTKMVGIHDATVESIQELAELVSRSIQIRSISGEEGPLAQFYESWMLDRDWIVDRQPLEDSLLAASETAAGFPGSGRFNLIGYPLGRPSGEDRVVVLNGHLDVVPAADHGSSRPPFSGERANGLIYGRGAVDTKGGIGAALIALDVLRRLAVPLAFTPALHLVVGEETTGVGTRLALHTLGAPAAAIVLEPTGNALVPICSGLQFFKLRVPGISAHTSTPWMGVDALARLLPLRESMLELAAERSASYTHPLFSELPTGIPFAIGQLRAGDYRASVPGHAEMSGRIGIAPGESAEEVRQAYSAVIAKKAAADPHEVELPHQLEWHGAEYPGWETSRSEALIAALDATLTEVTGKTRWLGFTAGSDAGQYGALGVPTALFGPGDTAVAHTSDERISEGELVRACVVLALTLARLA